jgi:large subunit ribosomal protein L19e
MNLRNKKELAAKTLHVGKSRIVFVLERMDEIKEALTKEDIRALHQEGAILVKDVKGRKTQIKKKKKRSVGNVRKKVNRRKKDYVIITRKLRGFIRELKNQGRLSNEEVKEIRKKIRNKEFKSKANLKTYIGELRK